MKFTKKILKNGLRVVTVPMQDNPAVTVMVMVEAGSNYETKETNGISHFLEHMVFKGTPRRPKASDISKELDGLGAEYNAFTGDEYTGYYAKVEKRHLNDALDIISDMYMNPLFPKEEIQKERGVIIEEIRMYKDRPDREVHNALSKRMYGDQPAGWTILGPEKNILSFGREHFLEYRKRHYVASSTIVVVAGGIDEQEVHRKVSKFFISISKDKKQPKIAVQESQTKPGVEVVFKDTGQTHIAFGIRTFSTFDSRKPVVQLLSTILGGGMSSRLFVKMRDELGLCYYIRSSQNSATDHGFLGISAGIDTTRVDLGITTILQEIKRLKKEPVSLAELKKAKDYLSGRIRLNLETSDARADYVAHQEILRREIDNPEDRIKKLQKVTAEEIQKLAEDFFVDKNLNLAIIGPYRDASRFKELLTFGK